ncbi:MAG: hypothetical protein SRB2_02954 [Desulfobacteraceae bacterium Eth-SRB2]|nr:MAG: hypothetical protein SRB2_02954 [Desulfobacteraceae bacterium Eth-SRB2]
MDPLEIIEDRLKKLKEKIDRAKLQFPIYFIKIPVMTYYSTLEMRVMRSLSRSIPFFAVSNIVSKRTLNSSGTFSKNSFGVALGFF